MTWNQHHISLILLTVFVNIFAEPTITVPGLGTLNGKELKTIRNQKSYYTFRNIPYAESVSGENRFSVSNLDSLHLRYLNLSKDTIKSIF